VYNIRIQSNGVLYIHQMRDHMKIRLIKTADELDPTTATDYHVWAETVLEFLAEMFINGKELPEGITKEDYKNAERELFHALADFHRTHQ